MTCLLLPKTMILSSPSKVSSGKFVLKICRNVISIKLLCNFIEIALQHGCSSVNLLHIFRTPFYKNIFGWLPLNTIHNSGDYADTIRQHILLTFYRKFLPMAVKKSNEKKYRQMSSNSELE